MAFDPTPFMISAEIAALTKTLGTPNNAPDELVSKRRNSMEHLASWLAAEVSGRLDAEQRYVDATSGVAVEHIEDGNLPHAAVRSAAQVDASFERIDEITDQMRALLTTWEETCGSIRKLIENAERTHLANMFPRYARKD